MLIATIERLTGLEWKGQSTVFLLGLGHGGIHWTAATLYLLLPFITRDLGLTYTEAGLLVAAAHTYLMAASQSEIPLEFSVFVKSVHPTVAILPIAIIVLWLVIPFEKRLSGVMVIALRLTSGSRRAARP